MGQYYCAHYTPLRPAICAHYASLDPALRTNPKTPSDCPHYMFHYGLLDTHCYYCQILMNNERLGKWSKQESAMVQQSLLAGDLGPPNAHYLITTLIENRRAVYEALMEASVTDSAKKQHLEAFDPRQTGDGSLMGVDKIGRV